MAEDYYRILGVDKDADIAKIKQAYRKEGKKSHPDASGVEGSASRFRDVEEVYETLRDRKRRQAYDRELGRREAAARHLERQPGRVWTSATSPRPDPLGTEPLGPGSPGRFPFGRAYPWAADLPLLKVLLSPREALSGVAIPLELPAGLPCPACEGPWARLSCPRCGGTGRVGSHDRIIVELPAGVRRGAEFPCRFGSSAAGGVGFRVRVLVGTP